MPPTMSTPTTASPSAMPPLPLPTMPAAPAPPAPPPLADFKNNPTYGTTRDGFGKGLLAAGEKNPNVVVLSADLSDSMRVLEFKKSFPERFFAMGVAEENMVGVAAGLALRNKIPVTASYAVFSPGNSLGPLRASVCYSKLHVIIVGGHTGFSASQDGATHQALEDLAIMRTLPNMTVISPADENEAMKAIQALTQIKGPGYLRISKTKTLNITSVNTPFEIGKASVISGDTSNDLAIIATGNMVAEALKAANSLSGRGISAQVINMHTIKPLDTEMILSAAEKTGAIVTAEEHSILGGLGSAVAEILAQHLPTPIEFVGSKDVFGESGIDRELMSKYGTDADQIVQKSLAILARKVRK